MYRSDSEYKWQWPADVIAAVSEDVYDGMNMISAWKVITKPRVAAAIDAVRNRLLSFLLDLREQHPEVEMTGGDLRSIPKEDDVRVSVVTNIYGGQNVVASGDGEPTSAPGYRAWRSPASAPGYRAWRSPVVIVST